MNAKLLVSYSQISVFHGDMENPFNDWTDEHVAQGFAWRPGSVSFMTLAESGVHSIYIGIVDSLGTLDDAAIRAIEVPFNAPESGVIEISSIHDSLSLSLPPGQYLLRCEILKPKENEDGAIKFLFLKKDSAEFSILRTDYEFPIDAIIKTASPALC